MVSSELIQKITAFFEGPEACMYGLIPESPTHQTIGLFGCMSRAWQEASGFRWVVPLFDVLRVTLEIAFPWFLAFGRIRSLFLLLLVCRWLVLQCQQIKPFVQMR